MITSILQRRACQTTNRPFYTCLPEKGGSLEIESLYQYLLFDSHHPLDKLGVTQTLHHQAEKNTDSNTSYMTTLWKQLSFDFNNFHVTSWREWKAQRFQKSGRLLDEASMWNVFGSLRLLPPCFSFVAGNSLYAQSPDQFWCVSNILVLPLPLRAEDCIDSVGRQSGKAGNSG